MPFTTYTLDNQLKINPDDIDDITNSLKEP
jgi:hypothetical protein